MAIKRIFQKNIFDLNETKPDSVRILIAQTRTTTEDWSYKDGLVFYNDPSVALDEIDKILIYGRQTAADMIVMPELSVPEKCIENIQIWSEQTGSVVIAGSHYHKTKNGYISRCPTIISGRIFFTHKIVPAPVEVSPINGQGLHPGTELSIFKNTSVGDFAILICSDFLDHKIRQELLSEKLDMLFVPAYQDKSETYHTRMNIECEESENGIYCIYANMLCGDHGDGKSAIFGQLDNIYLSKLIKEQITDSQLSCKVCQLYDGYHSMVIEVDINNKKPYRKRTVHTRPNIRLINLRKEEDSTSINFTRKIAHSDERYIKIKELFVEPIEYISLISKLESFKLLFIVGDPGIGKTYSSVRLLRHYYETGYEPIWFTGLEKEERRVQRQVLENFRPKDKQIIYFEDPFGRTIFEKRDSISQVFGPLADHLKDIDAYVIITSRKEIFEQFAKESLSANELKEFTEELNIVKPSYSAKALHDILQRLASERCRWFKISECYDYVSQEILDGKFTTPLAIRDFVFSTENVSSIFQLKERIEKRTHETKQSFSIEMQSGSIYTKLLLSVIFLFGKHSQASLSRWWAVSLRNAYSGEIVHLFRSYPSTRSETNRPVVPKQTVH